MTKQNGRCPLQQECERVCKVVGHERHCDYYVNNRYGTSGIPDQDQILDEEDAGKTREWGEEYFAVLDEDEETDGTKPAGDSKRIEPAADVCEAKAEQAPVFDYSVLDEETAYKLQGITQCVAELQKNYVWGMAYQVGQAHELLCGNGACETVSQAHKRNNQHSEATFTAWCDYIGVERRTAYNLLNAYRLICKATPEQQKILQRQPAKLLYIGGSQDTSEELANGILNGDITTHKQYQELLAEIRTRDAKISELIESSEASGRRADAAERRAQEAEAQRAAVLDKQGEYITRIHALESRPVEVAVQEPDPAEVERMAEEKARAMTAELRGQLKTAEGNIQRMKNIRDSLQSQLEDWQRAASRQATALTAENVLPMAQDLAGNIKALYNTFLLAAHGLHGEDYRRCAAPLAQALEEALGSLRANTAQYTANRYEEDEDFE